MQPVVGDQSTPTTYHSGFFHILPAHGKIVVRSLKRDCGEKNQVIRFINTNVSIERRAYVHFCTRRDEGGKVLEMSESNDHSLRTKISLLLQRDRRGEALRERLSA